MSVLLSTDSDATLGSFQSNVELLYHMQLGPEPLQTCIMDTMKRYAVTVTGRVQGVFFRQTALQIATGLGLTGFARNQPDGSVYIEVEGEEVKLQKFLEWCREGPQLAVVKDVSYRGQKPKGSQEFEIRY
jgi:acylphosphatase